MKLSSFGAGCWEAFLGFAPAQMAGKSAANKIPLSNMPACHIQAISPCSPVLAFSFLFCLLFSSSAVRQITREAGECVLPSPCAGLSQSAAAGPCEFFPLCFSSSQLWSNAATQELESKPRHPLGALRSSLCLCHQTWGLVVTWMGPGWPW